MENATVDWPGVVAGAFLGVMAAAVLATPFYGFAPILIVTGTLFALAVMVRLFGTEHDEGKR